MSTGWIVAWAVLAILVFWVVGAYNRLQRLRNAAAKAYAACDAVLVERIAETQRLCDALDAAGVAGREFVELARAAARQAAQACDAARARPLARRTMVKVAMALLVLDGALETLRRTALRAAAEASAPSSAAPAVPGEARLAPQTTGAMPAADGADIAGEAGAAAAAAAATEAGPTPIERGVQALAALSPRWEMAQTHYDQAASDYNDAAAQFPTRLVAMLFSLHPAQGLAPHWSDTLSATLAPPP